MNSQRNVFDRTFPVNDLPGRVRCASADSEDPRAILGVPAQPSKVERQRPVRVLNAQTFVDELLAWNALYGETGWIPYSELLKLAYECSEYYEVQLISSMAISKEFARRGIQKRWQYLKPKDPLFIRKKDNGQKRPRVMLVYLPRL